MAVPIVLTDLTVSEATNGPPDSESVTPATRPSDYLRAHAAFIRRMRAQGVALASAATVNIGAITDGEYVHITGVTTITAFDTIGAGVERALVFDGILTITHNSTSLILPGAANIVTAVGDVIVFVSEGGGNWRCKSYPLTIAKADSLYAKFPTGTRLSFIQAAAPTGWTVDATLNDKLIRIDSTAGGAIGGAWAISGLTTTVALHGLTEAENGPHFHVISNKYSTAVPVGALTVYVDAGTTALTNTASSGLGTPHGHAGSTTTGNGVWRPAYVNAIICTRN